MMAKQNLFVSNPCSFKQHNFATRTIIRIHHALLVPTMSLNISKSIRFGTTQARSGSTGAQVKHPYHGREVKRPSANYKPTIWTDDFVQSLKIHHMGVEEEERMKKMEEEVRRMITNESVDPLTTLEVIDDVGRLGLGYRFEKEIRNALGRFVDVSSRGFTEATKNSSSVHAIALIFRLLRQHGFHVSQDVFKNLMDDNYGTFKANLCVDVKGLLSLYEASHLGFEDERILDEAMEFTAKQLKNVSRVTEMRKQTSRSIMELVNHALEMPLHHRTQRLEARWYIEWYGKSQSANPILHHFAIQDFNLVQSTLKRDLQHMSRWWKDMGLAHKLSFSRDRLMECFFWTAGFVYKPFSGNARKVLTKVAAFITTIDDVYDVFATMEELELFTYVVERWDINNVKILPEYMRLCFLALYNTVNDMVYDTCKKNGEIILPYLVKAWADMFKAFLQEAKWHHKSNQIPSFKEYLENGWMSVSGIVILVHAYFLLNSSTPEDALRCIEEHHDLLRLPSVIFRLCNDMGTSSAEVERGESANSILCYARDNGVSEKIARKEIRNLTDNTWKKLNKYLVTDSPFTKDFVETIFNLARISECTYQYGDAHSVTDQRSKNRVQLLIIDPISSQRKAKKTPN